MGSHATQDSEPDNRRRRTSRGQVRDASRKVQRTYASVEAKFSSQFDEKETGVLTEQMASRLDTFFASSQLHHSGRSGNSIRFPVSVEQDLELNIRREGLSIHLHSPPETESAENSVGGTNFGPPIHFAQSAEDYFDLRHPIVDKFLWSSFSFDFVIFRAFLQALKLDIFFVFEIEADW